jgi:signal transduction histidine kinase
LNLAEEVIHKHYFMGLPVFAIPINREHDIVLSRQHARQIAAMLGSDSQDQIRFATAVSEIVRNAINYGGGGTVEFSLENSTPPQVLVVRISDTGPGIENLSELLNGQRRGTKGLGLTNARRLIDQFKIESAPGKGTVVEMRQSLPKTAPVITDDRLAQITEELERQRPQNPYDEIQRQNNELLRTLDELRRRQEDLLRVNQELEDTNRGVVALYAEIEDKAESLRRANEVKSRFLSYMSHEFRTPLNSVLALARLLLDRSDGELTEEQEKQVSFISKSAGEMTDLVNDLLDLAKIEAGKVEVHPSEFAVSSLFGALRGMLKPLLTNEQVTLVFEEPGEVPLLYSDEGKIAQILRNFLSNALKFTERGEVRVNAELTSDGQTIVFSVSDTGIGIAPEDQELIFEEFSQVKSTLQKRVKGTGLGLPLCRKLAELLGGSVMVKSEPGAGSTFSAIIPISHPLAHTSRVNRKVLIIDDEEASRYVLKKLFTAVQSEVLEASDGAWGLSLARDEQPDLISLDLVMPNVAGAEVLARLKADPLTNHIPVMIVSSKAMNRRERAHLASHAEALLSKADLSQKTLVAALERIWGSVEPSADDS